ncbi:MAG: aminotransferase class I/II-fold pyridoxal phosphate-dependent enzyme, partial [Actinomyces sp.]
QAVIADLVGRPGWLDEHLSRLRPVYRRRRDALVDAVDRFVPEASYATPAGGMFLWLRLDGVDTTRLLARALEVGVAFVPGAAFAVDADLGDHLRLSYATADPDAIEAGVARLAAALV